MWNEVQQFSSLSNVSLGELFQLLLLYRAYALYLKKMGTT